MKIRLITVVWGQEFVDIYLRLALRSLCAAGNLFELAKAHEIAYTVFTSQEDAERLGASPLWAKLVDGVDVRLEVFDEHDIDRKNPSSHWILWHRGVTAARNGGEFVFTIIPDIVYARGTLMRWAQLFASGYRAVFSPGPQVVLETVLADLESRFPSASGEPIDLPQMELMQVLYRHLHPIAITMFRNSPRWMRHPEHQLRAVPGEGFVMRALTSHPMAFDPAAFDMTDSFCPTNHLDLIAHDPCHFISAEPLMKGIQLYYSPWRMDDNTLSHFGHWGDLYFTPSNIAESRETYFFPFSQTTGDAALRRVDLESGFYVAQMQSSRVIYRLWKGLGEIGLGEAARWLAAAQFAGRMRRRITLRGPATLLVPYDCALAGLSSDIASRLLSAGGKALIDVLGDHIVGGHCSFRKGQRIGLGDGGTLVTVSGKSLAEQATGGAKVLLGPLRIDDVLVYAIDRPLTPWLSIDRETAPTTIMRLRGLFELVIRASGIFKAAGRAYRAAYEFAARSEILRRTVRAHRHFRAHGIGWGVARYLSTIGGDASVSAEVAVSTVAADPRGSFVEAQIWRATEVLNEVFEFYERRVLGSAPLRSAPGCLVRRALEGRAPGAYESELRGLVEMDANFAEAWLELGHLRAAQGDAEEALHAFARAASGQRRTTPGAEEPNIGLQAALARAEILAGRGDDEAALAELQRVSNYHRRPWSYNLLRARLLVRLGRPAEALPAYEQCLSLVSVAPMLPKFPRRFEQLLSRLAARPAPRSLAVGD